MTGIDQIGQAIWQFVIDIGLVGAIIAFLFWLIKRKIDQQEKRHQEAIEKQEKRQLEREENQKALFLMMMQSTRANAVGIKAIATAVQRIPDAHCNGDMTAALQVMSKQQEEEKEFLLKHGVEHIFDV